MIKWMHIPFALPELFLIPFIPYLQKNFDLKLSFRINLVVNLYIWVLLILIALAFNTFNPSSILSSSRGYLYIVLFYFIFSKPNKLTTESVLYISLGSLWGWAVDSYFNLQNAISLNEETVSYGAMLSIPLFISISLYKKKYLVFFIGVALIIWIAFTSGLRRQMLIATLSLIITLFFLISINWKRFFTISLLLITIIFSIYQVLPNFESFLKEEAPILHNRVFARTENVLNGVVTPSEEVRFKNFQYLQRTLESYIIPQGFVSKQTGLDSKTGIFNDFPLLELCQMLGFPIALALIIFFIAKVFMVFINQLKYGLQESYIYIVSFLVIMVLLFLDGTFLSYAYSTPFTGYCLGRLKYFSKLN
jgi:hypothetical protein